MSTNSPGTTVGRPQTIVYIDGFNFYHGAVKGTQYKWLDFTALCQRMLPRDQLSRSVTSLLGLVPDLAILNSPFARRRTCGLSRRCPS